MVMNSRTMRPLERSKNLQTFVEVSILSRLELIPLDLRFIIEYQIKMRKYGP
jgi:hypothetical protein